MLTGPGLRKADVVTALCLIAFGVSIIVASLDMPWGDAPRTLTRAWYLSPGLFPLILGALLILFSLRILSHAIGKGGHRGLARHVGAALRAAPGSRVLRRVVVIWVLLAAYIFSLKTLVGYYVATSLFLFAFMAVFYRPRERDRRPLDFAMLAAISVAVPFGFGLIFEELLATPLP